MIHHTLQSNLYPNFSEETLHVIVPLSNSQRFNSRYTLYQQFAKQVQRQKNVHLVTVEVAYGDRDFVSESLNPSGSHIQLRAKDELWLKENSINLAVQQGLPFDWKYMAWVDGDVNFVREDWAIETLHQLQHSPLVQMFSHATDLGPNYEPFATYDGFAYSMTANGGYAGPLSSKDAAAVVNTPYYEYPYYGANGTYHPGYAWAMTKEAYNGVGGLLDTAVVGSGDHHMILAAYGMADKSLPGNAPAGYADPVYIWQERALRTIKKNVGYVPGQLYHYWHGKKADRRYKQRWSIITDNKFDPRRDLVRDSQGLYQLSGENIGLRDDLRRYFNERNEDSVDR